MSPGRRRVRWLRGAKIEGDLGAYLNEPQALSEQGRRSVRVARSPLRHGVFTKRMANGCRGDRTSKVSATVSAAHRYTKVRDAVRPLLIPSCRDRHAVVVCHEPPVHLQEAALVALVRFAVGEDLLHFDSRNLVHVVRGASGCGWRLIGVGQERLPDEVW